MSDHEGNIPPDDAAEDPLDTIIQKTRRLTLLDKQPQDKANRTLDSAVRFHGKSTNFYLIMATREMRMMYFLESTGATPDTVNNELGRAATHGPDQHAQAFEGGLRRREYWRSLDVSIHFCPRQRCSTFLVVMLSFFHGTFEFLRSSVSPVGTRLRRRIPIIRKPLRTSSKLATVRSGDGSHRPLFPALQ
jgi:hypothetical protein